MFVYNGSFTSICLICLQFVAHIANRGSGRFCIHGRDGHSAMAKISFCLYILSSLCFDLDIGRWKVLVMNTIWIHILKQFWAGGGGGVKVGMEVGGVGGGTSAPDPSVWFDSYFTRMPRWLIHDFAVRCLSLHELFTCWIIVGFIISLIEVWANSIWTLLLIDWNA